MTDTPIFELNNVSKQFGNTAALQGVSLRVMPGERVALVGPSGAGKSTLINLLNGSLLPDQGEVRVMGQDLARLGTRKLRAIQRRVGTVHQQFDLVGNLRVIHNVNAGRLGDWPLWKAVASLIYPLNTQAAFDALTQVGIPEKLYERTDQLSGGQQQRVALARVLIQNPAAILADEPISSLDPGRSREIMDLFGALSQQTGKTLVVSLHAFEYALSHTDRLIGLRRGRVVFDAPAAEVTPAMAQSLYRIEV
ncbi:MAG: phosphonate ABC transporter ATP-binding protein [Anaerolineae bacterium]|nr:phosphonate ABC transporter ATP-binding protein [Anaerolineae bacterium]MCB9130304.1 phosphonate ABC transporter ATP-binding protein [Anaerolineales bacterium]HRX03738.1 phosphonate ABC transporter ATP-binding protein [Anaerolineae bacterium]